METQQEAAQRMYNARAENYEDSWHPDYSARLMKIVQVKPGDKVLVLACGTGLESFIAARDIGSSGQVTGVDITEGMLAQAEARQQREPDLGSRITFIRHDVTDLDSCKALEGLEGTFDIIICSSAFVLFDNPPAVVRGWKKWIKSDGGRLAIDITHEKNLIKGMVIEKVAEDMGLHWPSKRRWVKGKESFQNILEAEGYHVDHIELVDKMTGFPRLWFGIGEADTQFEEITHSPFTNFVWEDADMERARVLFRKEWSDIAVDGKVEVVDGVYVYLASRCE